LYYHPVMFYNINLCIRIISYVSLGNTYVFYLCDYILFSILIININVLN